MVQELQGDSSALCRLSAVQDDYEWWKARKYLPSAGKPLWLTLEKGSEDSAGGEWRHLFFDDNIHSDANDSIVAVRARLRAPDAFTAVSGEATVKLHGSVLKKVPTVRPILDHGWFLEQIDLSDARLATLGNAGGTSLRELLGFEE